MRFAIAISGETRNYNEQNGPDTIIKYLESQGHVVDLYGHTWDHCEVPFNKNIFKNFVMEPQSIIDDWIKEDFMFRAWSHVEYNPTCRLSDMTPDEFVHRILMTSRAKYGQHFSGLKSIHMVPLHQYDIVIRWRWDLRIAKNILQSDDMMDSFHKRMHWLERKNHQDFVVIQCSSNSWGSFWNYAIEDTHFFINKHAHEKLLEMSISDRFDSVFRKQNTNEKISYHTLWTELLCQSRIDFSFELISMTCFTGDRNHDLDPLSSS